MKELELIEAIMTDLDLIIRYSVEYQSETKLIELQRAILNTYQLTLGNLIGEYEASMAAYEQDQKLKELELDTEMRELRSAH